MSGQLRISSLLLLVKTESFHAERAVLPYCSCTQVRVHPTPDGKGSPPARLAFVRCRQNGFPHIRIDIEGTICMYGQCMWRRRAWGPPFDARALVQEEAEEEFIPEEEEEDRSRMERGYLIRPSGCRIRRSCKALCGSPLYRINAPIDRTSVLCAPSLARARSL